MFASAMNNWRKFGLMTTTSDPFIRRINTTGALQTSRLAQKEQLSFSLITASFAIVGSAGAFLRPESLCEDHSSL